MLKNKRQYFEKATKNGDLSHQNFWKILKLFLTNKECQSTGFTIKEKDGELISSEQTLQGS